MKQPAPNTVLAASGSAGNPTGGNQLSFCVAYTPDAAPDNDAVALQVSTNAAGPLEALLTAGPAEARQWRLTCADPAGKAGFHFPDAAKASFAHCSLCNVGAAPFSVTANAVAIEQADTAKVAAALTCSAVGNTATGGEPVPVGLGKCVTITCGYTPQPTGPPPNALCTLGPISAPVAVPISVGACDSPTLLFGPSAMQWSTAKPGAVATDTVVLANQSCAPLQLISACIASAGYTGAEPCKNPSKTHLLQQPFVPLAMAPMALAPVSVQFTPPLGETGKDIADELHVAYCKGTWTNGACSGPIVTRTLPLVGRVALTPLTPPTSGCALLDAKAPLHVGHAVALQDTVPNTGSFPQIQAFRWVVTKRPAGASTWVPPDVHNFDQTDQLTLLPDVAGDYEVRCQAQGIDATTAGNNVWSQFAPLQFAVVANEAPVKK